MGRSDEQCASNSYISSLTCFAMMLSIIIVFVAVLGLDSQDRCLCEDKKSMRWWILIPNNLQGNNPTKWWVLFGSIVMGILTSGICCVLSLNSR